MRLQGRRRRRSSTKLNALLSGLLLSAALASPAAAAAPDSTKGSPPVAAGVSMVLDCSSVPDTGEAKAAVRRYRVCGGGGGGDGGITPMGTVSNNCGDLSLNVANRGGGLMQWTGRITSRLGPFTSATYTGQWSNTTSLRQGPVNRSRFWFTSDWVDSFAIGSGPGSVFGIITWASVQLWWGPFCVSMLPVDSHTQVT
jgi:hypothetical protein